MNELQDYVTKALDKLQCEYYIKDDKLIISDEFQKETITYTDLPNYKFAFQVSNFAYPCSLSDELLKLNDEIEEKFDAYFECEYPTTFSLLLNQEN